MALPLASLLLLSPSVAPVAQSAPIVDPEGGLRPGPRPVLFDAPRRPVLAVDVPAPGRTASTVFLSLNQAPEGDMPRDVAFTPDGQRVLTVNRDTDNVTVYDFATRADIATIAVGDFPVDVEVSPDGRYAAVPNVLSDTVSFIDLATLTVAAEVPVTQTSGAGEPYKVAFDDGSSVCVVSVIDGAVQSRFSVIDLGTLTEVRSFQTTPHGAIGGFATPESAIFGNLFSDWDLASDGSFVLVPDRAGDTLNSYDVATGALLASVPVGDQPAWVDLAPDRSRAVVSLSGAVDAVVDVAMAGGVPTVGVTVPTVNQAFDPQVRLTPDRTRAIVAVLNAVEFIDLNAGSVLGTVSTGTVGDIEFTFDGLYAVVTNFNTRIIDLATRNVVRTLTVASTYDAAVSPVSHRLVGLNNRFAEDLHFYTTAGAAGSYEGRALAGSAPEVDAPRRVTVTPDGGRALVTGLTSRSVAQVDLRSGATTALYDAGDRVWEVATDAAGTVAVATSTESSTVQVIDLVAGAVVAELPVATRPTEVAVAPDGSEAYVITVAGTDRLHFIDLAGAASAVTGTLVTGQLGSIGYHYSQSSGIALSPDGGVLAICVSFDDQLLLVDTQTRAELGRVPVGDFPLWATWSPDGSSVFCGCPFDDTVYRVDVGGGAPAVGAVATGVADPFQLLTDAAGAFLYVGEYGFNVNSLAVLDAQTMARVATIGLPGRPAVMERVANRLFVTADDEVCRLTLAGAATTLDESIQVSGASADLAFSAANGLAVTTQPGAADGIDVTRFGGTASFGCAAELNSTGAAGQITATGTFLAGGLPLTLTGTSVPANQFGLLFTSRSPGDVFPVPNSQGRICLGGTIGRFNSLVTNSGPAGVLSMAVDTNALPQGAGTVPALPGETWYFQMWFRDVNPGVTSNFTNRVGVTFE